WQFWMDASIRRVFETARNPADVASVVLLVVENERATEPRLLDRSTFGIPHILWDLPPEAFAAALRDELTPPQGFDLGELREVPRPAAGDARIRLPWVELANIRCFEQRRVPLGPDFNVLIGRNGVGKTTILDASAEILRHIVNTLRAEPGS